jgi:nuclear GTP-binding protein
VYDVRETEAMKVLKGVVRAERIPDPESYVQPVLDNTERKHLVDVYGIANWESDLDFIEQVARNSGKLVKGGDPDVHNISI